MKNTTNKSRLTAKELCVFALLGAIMYLSKILMAALPNIHLLATFIIAETLVYGKKALYPLYVYVLLDGCFSGFALWWLPYLYIWTLLWAAAMLLPKDTISGKRALPAIVLSAAFGMLFGTLYAPAAAIIYGLDMKGLWAWIIGGLSFDAVHAAGNFALGFFILPLAKLLNKLDGDSVKG